MNPTFASKDIDDARWYSRHTTLTDRRAAIERDDALTPEEALIQREELEASGLDEPATRSPILPTKKLHEYLARLSADDRDALTAYFSGMQSQTAFAARVGISQPGMSWRIAHALRRLRWLAGPGSLFTSEDVERDLRGVLSYEEVRALAIYWRTTFQSDVMRELRLEKHPYHLLHGAIAKLSGRYRRGFDALLAEGKRLLDAGPARPFSALGDFIARRVVFRVGETVAKRTLLSAYVGHASALGRPWDTGKLRVELIANGARETSVRVDWAHNPVSAFAGIQIRSRRWTDANRAVSSARA
jgi:hypothetical protein